MARNLSVEQFKQLMERIPKEVAVSLESAVTEGAEGMAQTMRSSVAQGIDGRHELLESIRVTPGSHPLRKVVRAGGPLTTKKAGGGFLRRLISGRGKEYDYANAVEFGTQEMPAQPFFWPSYRLTKRPFRSRIARKVNAVMKKYVASTS